MPWHEAGPRRTWWDVARSVLTVAGAALILVVAIAILNAVRLDPPAVPVSATAPLAPAQVADPAATHPDPAAQAVAGAPGRIDPDWLARTSAVAGIPPRALAAYAAADLAVDAEQPECGIGWNTLAGIGLIESGHGTFGGAILGPDGYPNPAIRGIPLNGDGVMAIRDTDGGAWDGDTVWDRAVGPMQFIPSTWEIWGSDGNGDGVADPNQIDDAALAAARYLCASGPMTSVEGWRAAVLTYNNLDVYVNDVADAANHYAARAGAG